MLRQPSSRNPRTRGFRLKQALQIGILVAVCIWLLYQVKHSHDKKTAYDARNSKITSKSVEDQEDFFKFGRRDLTRNGDMHKGEESEEAQEEEEPEIKQEETEDEEMRGAGDDGTDEQSQKNVDEETERGAEDSTEEEGKEGHMEEPDPFDSRDHEEGTQAREENYRSDDASSAVAHEAQAKESETVKEDARSTDGEHVVDSSKGDTNSTSDGTERQQEMLAENAVNGRTVDGSEADNRTVDGSVNNLSDGVKDNSTMLIDNNPANNGAAAENKEPEAGTSNPDDALVTNSTATADDDVDSKMQLSANSTASVSENQTEGQNSSTVVELPAEVQKDTVTVVDSAEDQNTTVVDQGTPAEGEANFGNVVDGAEKSNSTAALGLEEQSTTSSATDGTADAGTGETDHDPTHAVSEEEREARTDLSTLPDIQNEARAMDDDAAE
ncbi:uncharacterized protein M6B38_315090 [Iris pallida]|uniref:Uncharacterized protein n=1 Tax=Iris pallida TaxID=29817 RepID=A0AAX6HE30_IRIPA|nr:uncharacterized protein M6B38_315090 [Iris pallida]